MGGNAFKKKWCREQAVLANQRNDLVRGGKKGDQIDKAQQSKDEKASQPVGGRGFGKSGLEVIVVGSSHIRSWTLDTLFQPVRKENWGLRMKRVLSRAAIASFEKLISAGE